MRGYPEHIQYDKTAGWPQLHQTLSSVGSLQHSQTPNWCGGACYPPPQEPTPQLALWPQAATLRALLCWCPEMEKSVVGNNTPSRITHIVHRQKLWFCRVRVTVRIRVRF